MKKVIFTACIFLLSINLVNAETYEKFSCGEVFFPMYLANLTSTIISILIIVIPIVIIVLGSIDLLKGVMAQKEEDIKKAFPKFLKRLIVGCIVFLVIALVRLVISIAGGEDANSQINCMNCFVNGGVSCKSTGGNSSNSQGESEEGNNNNPEIPGGTIELPN